MRKLFITVFTLALTVMLMLAPLSCYGQGNGQAHLYDDAFILTDSQQSNLLSSMEKLSDTYGCNVAVFLLPYADESALDYAHARYDELYGYGTDGIALVINTHQNTREWAISFNGKYAAFENYDLMSTATPYLRIDAYYDALTQFLSSAELLMAYQVENPTSSTQDPFIVFAVCFIIGLIIALIVVMCMKRALKSVRRKSAAGEYVVKDSFHLTRSTDLYLYSTVTKVPVPKSSSSSGSSRGGASGRF